MLDEDANEESCEDDDDDKGKEEQVSLFDGLVIVLTRTCYSHPRTTRQLEPRKAMSKLVLS